MPLEFWKEDFDEFFAEREETLKDDGDPDDFRRGYRQGYLDALRYVKDWTDEEGGVD
jgi:hypothetical protein